MLRHFTIVQQRRLKLAFFVGIYLPYLVPPGLRSELNALLLRLLHESITSLFIRQRHSQLFDLSIKLLRILLTFSNSIFPFQVKQTCFRVIQQIAAYLAEVKRSILSHSNIRTLFCLRKITCILPCNIEQNITDTASETMRSLRRTPLL